MNKFLSLILLIIFVKCQTPNQIANNYKTKQPINMSPDSIIKKYVTNCAERFNYRYQMKEWQHCLNMGLEQDSTVAYLWQQKAMPYFKFRKYEVGMKYLDKAVFHDPKNWLSYRAFIKCVFAKTYKEAIKDFDLCIKMDGNNYVQDHTYQFYRALCYLQLNEFKKAETIFNQDIKEQELEWGEAHFLDLFYYAISKYEQNKWEEAIIEFNKSLQQYKQFSEAKYYKALCLRKLGKTEEYKVLMKAYKLDKNNGYSISESNEVYEPYPYQIVW